MVTLLRDLRLYLFSPLGEERGATMVEFGLLIALIAVVVAVAASALGQGLAGTFQNVANGLDRCAKLAANEAAAPAQDSIGGWKCQQ